MRHVMAKWRRRREVARLARGQIVQPAATADDLHAFAAAMRAACAAVPLIRIGGEGDGGYLLPDDFDGIRHCFSPGIDVTAGFEDEIARRYGIRSFMADASVTRAPLDNPLFEFDARFLGAHSDAIFTTLGDWVEDKLGGARDNDMLLQMDIEGGEFDVLIESDSALLRRFRIMVIEFHDMERIFERHGLPLIRALFAKLHRDFAIVHMHANNCTGIARCHGIGIPPVFEITYLRRDRLPEGAQTGALALPHPLDRDNLPTMPPITMPEIWWRA
jgi:hypothetical protein